MSGHGATVRRMIRRTVVLALVTAGVARAQTISVSGNPAAMKVQLAVAGSALTAVSNSVTTYTVHTSTSSLQKITAQINSTMPAGVTLTITLAAPTGATSLGAIALSTTAQTVVTNIPKNSSSTHSITYVLSATEAAGVVTSRTRTVTFTVINAP